MRKQILLVVLISLGFSGEMSVLADPADPIIIQGDSVITQGDFDARISKIKQAQQLPFLTDGTRVEKILRQMMMDRRLADAARKTGFEKDPLVQGRLKLAMDQELAKAWLDSIEASKLEAADFELMAKEYYLTHKSDFKIPASVDIAHILIGTENRTEAESLTLANDLYTRLSANPDLWDELVLEYSDDPGSKASQGKYLAVVPGKMVKPFEDTAFAMSTPGEIAAPVKTQHGYHIIRLDAKSPHKTRSFEEMKPQLVAQRRSIYTRAARTDYISALNTEAPLQIPDCAIEEMNQRYFDTEEAKAAYIECRERPKQK